MQNYEQLSKNAVVVKSRSNRLNKLNAQYVAKGKERMQAKIAKQQNASYVTNFVDISRVKRSQYDSGTSL